MLTYGCVMSGANFYKHPSYKFKFNVSALDLKSELLLGDLLVVQNFAKKYVGEMNT